MQRFLPPSRSPRWGRMATGRVCGRKSFERSASAFADYEVLEMLLFLAFKRGDTKRLAKAVINRFGSFAGVLTAPDLELLATPGFGEHAVSAIKVVREAALRLLKAEVISRPLLNDWDRLMDYLDAVLARERVEQFRVLFLDTRNRLLGDEAQARGTVNHTPEYLREVIERALGFPATAIILVHNHPSGDPTPSRDDIEMTQEVRQAASVLKIVPADHVIVGNGRWLSFRKEGLLSPPVDVRPLRPRTPCWGHDVAEPTKSLLDTNGPYRSARLFGPVRLRGRRVARPEVASSGVAPVRGQRAMGAVGILVLDRESPRRGRCTLHPPRPRCTDAAVDG